MKNKFVAGLAALLSILYLLNPTFGVFEFIPDNIPGFGNLDEGAAGAILIWAIGVLRQKPLKQAKEDPGADRP
ncbi:MAG: DUF1232 domain-containing protein [Candidatus Methylacidiphilales bacterium]|nr:DUF1232 domain-containing protein [Candidatus Methylacidiphilales bacterium]